MALTLSWTIEENGQSKTFTYAVPAELVADAKAAIWSWAATEDEKAAAEDAGGPTPQEYATMWGRIVWKRVQGVWHKYIKHQMPLAELPGEPDET